MSGLKNEENNVPTCTRHSLSLIYIILCHHNCKYFTQKSMNYFFHNAFVYIVKMEVCFELS